MSTTQGNGSLIASRSGLAVRSHKLSARVWWLTLPYLGWVGYRDKELEADGTCPKPPWYAWPLSWLNRLAANWPGFEAFEPMPPIICDCDRCSLIASRRLAELEQLCASPSDGHSAGVWCEAANEALALLHDAQDAIRKWFDAEGDLADSTPWHRETGDWRAYREAKQRYRAALVRLSQVAPDA